MNRNRLSGRYEFDGDLTRACKCGHRLGVHLAGGKECIVHDADYGIGQCECTRFRPRVAMTIERAASFLADDYFRQGGKFKRGQVERMAKKYDLDSFQLSIAVDSALGGK
jgi:hypothetical protein